MKSFFPKFWFLVFLAAGSFATAGVPSLHVTVSDPAGKAAFKGVTKADGAFATSKLPAGNYVVQFTTTNSLAKSGQYSIVVAAGSKKVVANAVAGEKLLGAGVAMKVAVGTGLNITGQVVAGPSVDSAAHRDSVTRSQDRAQDSHQQGFHTPISQTPDKMIRPGGN
jgi:hypothetical protein